MKSLSKNRQEREHRVFQDEAVTCPMPQDVRKEYTQSATEAEVIEVYTTVRKGQELRKSHEGPFMLSQGVWVPLCL